MDVFRKQALFPDETEALVLKDQLVMTGLTKKVAAGG